MVAPTPVEIETLLYRKEGFRDGRPCLAGTGMTVHTVAAHHLMGLPPEEILREFPHIDMPRIYAALAYFAANRELVLAELSAGVEEGDRLADAPDPGLNRR